MNVAKMERTLRGLVRLARRPDGRGGTLGDDPRLAEAIGRLATDTAAMRCLGYRGFAKASRGEMPPEHMVLKLFTSEAEQRACLLAQEALGLEGLDLDGPGPTASPSGTSPTSSRTASRERHRLLLRRRLGRCSTCARSPAPSPAARRRSSATSWPSACSACPGGEGPAPPHAAVDRAGRPTPSAPVRSSRAPVCGGACRRCRRADDRRLHPRCVREPCMSCAGTARGSG